MEKRIGLSEELKAEMLQALKNKDQQHRIKEMYRAVDEDSFVPCIAIELDDGQKIIFKYELIEDRKAMNGKFEWEIK